MAVRNRRGEGGNNSDKGGLDASKKHTDEIHLFKSDCMYWFYLCMISTVCLWIRQLCSTVTAQLVISVLWIMDEL